MSLVFTKKYKSLHPFLETLCCLPNMNEIELKLLGIESEKSKRRAVRTIAGIEGVESIAVDKKENRITVIGDVDPVYVANRFRKLFRTNLISAGPAKEKILWA